MYHNENGTRDILAKISKTAFQLPTITGIRQKVDSVESLSSYLQDHFRLLTVAAQQRYPTTVPCCLGESLSSGPSYFHIITFTNLVINHHVIQAPIDSVVPNHLSVALFRKYAVVRHFSVSRMFFIFIFD